MYKRIASICVILVSGYLSGCGSDAAQPSSGGSWSSSSWTPPPPPSNRPLPGGDQEPQIDSEATSFYFSYDESASTASRDLSVFAIQNNGFLDMGWGRPYEFLNAESFSHFAPQALGPFDVSLGLIESTDQQIPVGQSYEGSLYTLGVKLSGPQMSRDDRKNVVLTFVVDISGSMQTAYANETRRDISSLLDVTKHALTNVVDSLKEGDIVNLITFDTDAQRVLTNWTYSPADDEYLESVSSLRTQGSTNLNRGIELGYQVAMETYDETKANRVIMLTDAYANTGEVNVDVIANHTVINDLEGIHFAGIGIGSGFQEAFLNELTDAGKGAYSAMITPSDAERIMTTGFMRFIDNALTNVKFRLDYPQSLDQLQSSAEEVSESASDVRPSHFAFNSSQFFLEFFNGSADASDSITLTVEFDGDDGESETLSVTESVEALLAQSSDEIKAAVLVTRLAKLIGAEMTCAEVIDSPLFSEASDHLLFVDYQGLIQNYCEN